MDYDLSEITCSEEWHELSGWTGEGDDFSKLSELAALRKRLRDESLQEMTREEREAYEAGEGPFSNVERFQEAVEYAAEIINEVESLDYVSVVSIDAYHGGTLVMTAHLNKLVDWRIYRKEIPEVWKGVPIFVLQPRELL